ncbi:putative F-box protein [Namao virus]|nr:putative F-box protein [Namao virus]
MWNYLPFDLFLKIAEYLDLFSLQAIALVCVQWNFMVKDGPVWKHLQNPPRYAPKSWRTYSILNYLKKNLILNPDSDSYTYHWTKKNTYYSKWYSVTMYNKVKNTNEHFPDKNIFTYFICKAGQGVLFQTVDLWSSGYSQSLLNTIRPDISICFWYAKENDNTCRYKYCIELISDDMVILERICVSVKCWKLKTLSWQKANHCFYDYPVQARYVHLSHFVVTGSNGMGVGFTGHKLYVVYPRRDICFEEGSDLTTMFYGGNANKMVYVDEPCAPCNCSVCDQPNCKKLSCIQYKCKRITCERRYTGAGVAFSLCYSDKIICNCASCNVINCKCPNCYNMVKYYIRCACACNCEKCTYCNREGVKCACTKCRCTRCNTDCPCITCSCDIQSIKRRYDMKICYINVRSHVKEN